MPILKSMPLVQYKEYVRALLVLIATASLLSLLAWFKYRLVFSESIYFFLWVFAAFYTLGNIVLSLVSKSETNLINKAVISLGLGFVLFTLVASLVRRIGLGEEIISWVVMLQTVVWLFVVGKPRESQGNRLSLTMGETAALGILLLAILTLLHHSHFGDLIIENEGFSFRTSYLTESVFHLGIINALHDGFPPPALYASGTTDFSYYHLGMHHQIASAAALTGIDTMRLVSYYFPFVYFSLLALLPFVFVRIIGGSIILGVVAGLLVFASDFSFIPGIMYGRPDFPWTLHFPTTIWSLFTLNGYMPAAVTLFLSIIFLSKFLVHDKTSYLFLFCLCVIAAYFFKASMGMQLAAACLAAGVSVLIGKIDLNTGKRLLIAGASVLVILFLIVLLTGNPGAVHVGFAPFHLLESSLLLLDLGMPDLSWLPVFVAVFLIASLGLRFVGFFTLNRIKKDHQLFPLLLFICLFFIGGYVLSESLFVGRRGGQNNAIWFFVQSLMSAWFLLFVFLKEIKVQGMKLHAVHAVILLVSSISTVQFLSLRSSDEYQRFGPGSVEVISFLKTTNPGAVILHPLNSDVPSLASNFAGRSSVLNPFRSFVVEEDGLSARVGDINAFFDPASSEESRQEILRKYDVDYVYMPSALSSEIGSIPDLKPVIGNKEWNVLEVGSTVNRN